MFSDVWITTGGAVSSELTRYIGEAVDTCIQQSENADIRKPIIIGFTELSCIINRDEIYEQAYDISTVNQQVLAAADHFSVFMSVYV